MDARALRNHLLAGLLLLGGCALPATSDDDWDDDPPFTPSLSQIDLGVGVRSFDDADWEPTEDMTSLSFDYQDRNRVGPFALEGGIHYARDRGRLATPTGDETVESQVWELSAGLRTTLWTRRFPLVPYLGGGGALLFADVEAEDGTGSIDDDDVVLGGYAKGGLLLPLSSGAHLALEVRWFGGEELVLDGVGLEPDSTRVAIVFGSRIR